MPEIIKVGDQNNLVHTSNYEYANWAKFSQFNPIQSRLVEIYEGDSNVAIAASTSGGKAQPDDSLILTPNGYVLLKDIKIGDEVVGSNGFATKVVGVFPQGEKSVYSIKFDDDTETLCCNEHLWLARTRNEKKQGMDFKVRSTQELIDKFSFKKFHIPFTQPIQFKPSIDSTSNRSLHPYLLGIILGDGGIKYGTKISNAEDEILKRVSSLLSPDCNLSHNKDYDYLISTNLVPYNPVARELDLMGLLGKGSEDKFIPYTYLFSSIQCRLELLQGLMDSDGGGYTGEKSPTFEVTSKNLALGMAFLVRSLGGWTRIREKKESKYTYKGEVRNGKPVFRMTIILPFNPFGYSAKKNKWSPRKKEKLRSMVSITPMGVRNCRCIKVANENGLYITNDFIVTHNTVCAEIYMAYEVRKRGGKAIYIGPLKALTKEKEIEWSDKDHHFGDLKTSICTGDYRLTTNRVKELDAADLIVMTPEMLSSRVRNQKSEKSNFLKQIGCIVFDESHLLTVPGRGDHIEVALMKITEMNPNVRIVLLSATMPNVDNICEWVTKLTNRDTYYLESSYRPVPLNVHYETYWDAGKYDEKEQEKVATAVGIVSYHKDDKFLVFVHTKRTGQLIVDTLKRHGIESEFHNADLTLEKRLKLEKKFKEDKNFRVVVATSTLAWGINMPARRVVIVGVDRGLQRVENYDINQMIGRSGRLGLDPRGDAYILVPESKKDDVIRSLKANPLIKSQLLEDVGGHHKTLAFHVVSEIHHGNIKTKDAFHEWFRRSLAYHQNLSFGDVAIDKVIDLLLKCKAIMIEDGEYKATSIGIIASMFYFSPFDVADLRTNFKDVFDRNRQDDDYAVSIALGNLDGNRFGIVNKNEKTEMSRYQTQIERMFGKGKLLDPAIKISCAYYNMLHGLDSPTFASIQSGLRFDFDRTAEVLNAIDSMTMKGANSSFFKTLKMRVAYGVRSELVPLCEIPNVGKVRAENLYNAGVRNVDDFITTGSDRLAKIMNLKKDRVEECLHGARSIKLKESM